MHTDYKSRGGQLPVRWTAIEALENRKFNEKTDVWSCGVLLYEIWTNGMLPYKGWTNQKVWVEVAAGYRLPKPDGCMDEVYKEMLQCWAEEQDGRPTFRELAAFFRPFGQEDDAELVEGFDDGYLQVHLCACVPVFSCALLACAFAQHRPFDPDPCSLSLSHSLLHSLTSFTHSWFSC